jgi:pimeloyl-ACP methyl ester carboxylesterase
MAENLQDLPKIIRALDGERSLGDLPITVLSAANSSPMGLAEHDAEAKLSTRGTHVVVPNSTHWLMLDQPEVVAAAILEMTCRRN